MIQILLHNLKMDPLVSLHYYAPVCALINLFFLPFTEGLAPFYELQKVGILVLVSNAAVAFFLNVAAVFLVGVGSGLVLTLAGVFKVGLALSFHVFRFSFHLSGNIVSSYYGPRRVQVNSTSVFGFHYLFAGSTLGCDGSICCFMRSLNRRSTWPSSSCAF
jgi:hypothetical protein